MKVKVVRDLRSQFGPARHQGSRPTCCAFACSDFHAAARSVWQELSSEYAHYHGTRRQGTGPGEGVYLRHMLDVLEHDGQPAESGWPYLSYIPPDPLVWKPPASVGTLFYCTAKKSVGKIAELHAILDGGAAVLVVMSLSDSFYFPDGDGVIDSTEATETARVHAVVAVGHGKRGTQTMTLIRNSWGTRWGVSGYAWLTNRYFDPRIMELATITKAA